MGSVWCPTILYVLPVAVLCSLAIVSEPVNSSCWSLAIDRERLEM